MNKKNYFWTFFLFFLLNSLSFGALPTPASEPIPSYHETNNSDVVLTEKVQKKISAHQRLKHQPISAASHQGIIFLQGSVNSKSQEKIAVELAKSVKGVKKVESQLTIRATPYPPPAPAQPPAY